MRWPSVGTSVALVRTVTADDRARFDDEEIHDVYSTVATVRDVEHVSRWLFRRCLEDGEEGAGAAISIRHHAPVPVGAEVVLVATVTEAAGRRMVTEVEVRHEGQVAATGVFTQVVIDPERWESSSGRGTRSNVAVSDPRGRRRSKSPR